MTGDKTDEETYSVIFTSLKHPIRRKILRMLSEKPLTFSEIMESISIDSGHLSYHLESFGDLVSHAQDGKYQLSSIGIAAVRFMSGVEEHPPTSSRTKSKLSTVALNTYPLILASALMLVSLYLVIYAMQPSTYKPTTFTLEPPDSHLIYHVFVSNASWQLFYLGVVGLAVGLLYPILVIGKFLMQRQKKDQL